MTPTLVEFFVEGKPVPKQSFRAVRGHGYTEPHVKAWQECVTLAARQAWPHEPMTGPVKARLVFYLPDYKAKDADNLSKGVLDGLNEIIWKDDKQVVDLHIVKRVDRARPGVFVQVWDYSFENYGELEY